VATEPTCILHGGAVSLYKLDKHHGDCQNGCGPFLKDSEQSYHRGCGDQIVRNPKEEAGTAKNAKIRPQPFVRIQVEHNMGAWGYLRGKRERGKEETE
jgi:hypothetical protein